MIILQQLGHVGIDHGGVVLAANDPQERPRRNDVGGQHPAAHELIADEATAQLDPLSRQEIVTLLHQLNSEYGLTIIHVTHLLEEVVRAQRIIIMEQGNIMMEGRPADIFADMERLRQLKLAIPEPIELATRLRDAGLPISPEALTVEDIAQEIAG